MRRPDSRGPIAAIAASLLVHAAVLGWLATRPERREPDIPRPLLVELIEVLLPPALPDPAPPAAAPSSAAPPRVAAQPVRPSALPAQPASPGDPAAPADGPRLSAPFAADAPIADAPLAQPLVPVPSEKLSLALTPPPPPEERRGFRAPAIPEDVLGQAVHDTIGRAKVDRGLVHPYYSSLGKQLIRSWDADRAVSRQGLRGLTEQFAENSKAWNSIWLEHAAAFGANGTPSLEDAASSQRRPTTAAERLDPNLAARREVQRQMRTQFRSTRRATIKVVQDRKGALLSVELVSPSNDAHVDHEAVADIRSAAQKLPPPPAEASGGRERLVSLWQFELIVSITPPVPTFSFEFDEALRFIDTRMPLDRRIYKRVKLLSVE